MRSHAHAYMYPLCFSLPPSPLVHLSTKVILLAMPSFSGGAHIMPADPHATQDCPPLELRGRCASKSAILVYTHMYLNMVSSFLQSLDIAATAWSRASTIEHSARATEKCTQVYTTVQKCKSASAHLDICMHCGGVCKEEIVAGMRTTALTPKQTSTISHMVDCICLPKCQFRCRRRHWRLYRLSRLGRVARMGTLMISAILKCRRVAVSLCFVEDAHIDCGPLQYLDHLVSAKV
mmetsp:Transcript_57012/g.185306  ORF Transcript_57012/g.185306 Transcript_57012/m.185306 type:complete len:235 (-) Transcript_57012:626-1330(-)